MAIKDLVPRFGKGRERMPARRGESDPFREFHREMNRLFDDFFQDFGLTPRWASGTREAFPETFSPRVDITETDKELTISAELPGMEEKDVSVELDEETVTIRGERKDEQEERGKSWYRREQSYGSFHRVIALPGHVDADKAKARFKKGVLSVTVPKREEEQAKRKMIEIETD